MADHRGPTTVTGSERPGPFSVDHLVGDLGALGLENGETVLVHSSLSALGYVIGGAHAVVLALLETLGQGTLVVPTHSSDLTDPGGWTHPAVPEAWWPTIRATMPAFDARLTPTRHMGAIPDVVRHAPAALRSDHPTFSFCAVGPRALAITANHALADGLGEHSPLARLYDLDGRVLLLGVGHDRNTTLHLAEGRSGRARRVSEGAPVTLDGQRAWVTFETLDYDSSDFLEVGRAAGARGLETVGPVGAAIARLMSVRALVDFATTWMQAHRPPRG